jgi:hypothetical protein
MGSGVGAGTCRRVVLLELDLRPVVFQSTVMSNAVPKQPSATDAARSDAPAAHPTDRPLPDFEPHSPIEREIERSERASAALAATRALTRAAFTDSQLAAEDTSADDSDTAGWIPTEYAGLDHAVAPRGPQDDPADAARAGAASGRNLVGGTFNPGIAAQHGRAFPSTSIANSQFKTRTGAHARFLQESRQTPRGDRVATAAARIEQSPAGRVARSGKPAPSAAPAARRRATAPARKPAGEPFRFALAAGLGAIVVLMAGGVAWKAGLLSQPSPTNASLVTAQVAAQAEAARALAASQQELAVAPPAAGAVPARSGEEVDAALAAAARAAAVPLASVQAAGPSRVARPLPAGASAATPPGVSATPAHRKDGVAAAVTNAQVRADHFLAGASAGAAAPGAELEPGQ